MYRIEEIHIFPFKWWILSPISAQIFSTASGVKGHIREEVTVYPLTALFESSAELYYTVLLLSFSSATNLSLLYIEFFQSFKSIRTAHTWN
jgi:hypothetical protein